MSSGLDITPDINAEQASQDKAKQEKEEKKAEKHCLVKFRPSKNWTGDYGFDWVREESDVYKEMFINYNDPIEDTQFSESSRNALNALAMSCQNIKQALSDKQNVVEYAYEPLSRNDFRTVFSVTYNVLGDGLWKMKDMLYYDSWNGDVLAFDLEKRNNPRRFLNGFLAYNANFDENPLEYDKISCYVDENSKKVFLPYYSHLDDFAKRNPDIKSYNLNSKVYMSDEGRKVDTLLVLFDFLQTIHNYVESNDKYKNPDGYDTIFGNLFANKYLVNNSKKKRFCLGNFASWPYRKITFTEENDKEKNKYSLVFRTLNNVKLIFVSVETNAKQFTIGKSTNNYNYIFTFTNNNGTWVKDDQRLVDSYAATHCEEAKHLGRIDIDDNTGEVINGFEHEAGFKKNNEVRSHVESMFGYGDMELPELSKELTQKKYTDIVVELFIPKSLEMHELGSFEEVKIDNKTVPDSSVTIGDQTFVFAGREIEYVGFPIKRFVKFGNHNIPLKLWLDEFVRENFQIAKITHIQDSKWQKIFYPVPILTTELALLSKKRYDFQDVLTFKTLISTEINQSDEFKIQYFMDDNYDIPDKLRLQSECPMLSFKKEMGGSGFENPLTIDHPGKNGTVVVKIQGCAKTCDFCTRNPENVEVKRYYEKTSFRKSSLLNNSNENTVCELFKPTILARGEFEGFDYYPNEILPKDVCGQLDLRIGSNLMQPLMFVKVNVKNKQGIVMQHSERLDETMKHQKRFIWNVASQAGVTVDILDDYEITLGFKEVDGYRNKAGALDTHSTVIVGYEKTTYCKHFMERVMLKKFFEVYSKNETLKKYSVKNPIIFILDMPFTRFSAFQTFVHFESKIINVIMVSNLIKDRVEANICIHEIIHSLHLPHSFQLRTCEEYGNNKFCLRFRNTSNVMDYGAFLYSTRAIQWNRIRNAVKNNLCSDTFELLFLRMEMSQKMEERSQKFKESSSQTDSNNQQGVVN